MHVNIHPHPFLCNNKKQQTAGQNRRPSRLCFSFRPTTTAFIPLIKYIKNRTIGSKVLWNTSHTWKSSVRFNTKTFFRTIRWDYQIRSIVVASFDAHKSGNCSFDYSHNYITSRGRSFACCILTKGIPGRRIGTRFGSKRKGILLPRRRHKQVSAELLLVSVPSVKVSCDDKSCR